MKRLPVFLVLCFCLLGVLQWASCNINTPANAAPPNVTAWDGNQSWRPSVAVSTAAMSNSGEQLNEQAIQQRLGRLNFVQRRRLGLTIRNILPIVKDMKQAGVIDENTSPSTVAALVMEELVQQNAEAYGAPGIDWDNILDFIERLIPLILQIITLF